MLVTWTRLDTLFENFLITNFAQIVINYNLNDVLYLRKLSSDLFRLRSYGKSYSQGWQTLIYFLFPTALILSSLPSLMTIPVHRPSTLIRICKGNTNYLWMSCCTRRQNGFSRWRVRSRSKWFTLPGTYWRNEAPSWPDDHAAKWLNTNIRGSYTRDGRWRSVRPPSKWLPWRGSIYELACLLRALIVFSLRIPRSSSTPDGKLSRPDLASRLWNSSVSFSSRGYFLLPLLWNLFLFFLSLSLFPVRCIFFLFAVRFFLCTRAVSCLFVRFTFVLTRTLVREARFQLL